MENGSVTSDFLLLGLFSHTRLHFLLFSAMLAVTTVSIMGNTFLLLLILRDRRLHTPMYRLLGQLALMDLMIVSAIVPKMAADYLTGNMSISRAACGAQIFSLVTLAGGECFLLAAMSYDRYVAICHPLRYLVLMNRRLCLQMTAGSWVLGAADGILQAAVTLSFPFCGSHEIDHFLCEAPALVPLACADMSVFEYLMYTCCVLMLLVPFALILASYGLILAAVLRMRSVEACRKALATCSSHLVVVGLFFGAGLFEYMRPMSHRSASHNKAVSTFYIIFTPVLNPLIYSLRNSDVKGALIKCRAQAAALLSRIPAVCPIFHARAK
ncbi:olfactory receptor 2T8 [Ochotona curzoniae]|uniref:olfactory receptor 2T8 n=1 Tax=Ochotona curzoniae TaxID=130825 RepID=UPI001B35109A|nr:olfactory receptor 2T8 [Ochotona curzoniae]